MRRLPAAAVMVSLMAGCGGAGAHRPPGLGRLPLVPGARVVATARDCDGGAASYCALEAVVIGPRYGTSARLFAAEQRRLARAGWSLANGYTGQERGAESPGHRVRVTFAPADQDLRGIDLGWIRRPRAITLALSRALYRHAPALSITLETGSA